MFKITALQIRYLCARDENKFHNLLSPRGSLPHLSFMFARRRRHMQTGT